MAKRFQGNKGPDYYYHPDIKVESYRLYFINLARMESFVKQIELMR